MITERNISILAEEALEDPKLFIIEVKVGNGNAIHIFIEGDDGVTVNDCKKVSRHIEGSLDRDKEDYSLEVSSAGLSRPLTLLRQYNKNIGRSLKVVQEDGQVKIGKLIGANEQGITLEIKGVKKKDPSITEVLNLNTIKEAKIEITF